MFLPRSSKNWQKLRSGPVNRSRHALAGTVDAKFIQGSGKQHAQTWNDASHLDVAGCDATVEALASGISTCGSPMVLYPRQELGPPPTSRPPTPRAFHDLPPAAPSRAPVIRRGRQFAHSFDHQFARTCVYECTSVRVFFVII